MTNHSQAVPSFTTSRSQVAAPTLAAGAAALLLLSTLPATGETYNLATGSTWNATGSWNPASIPNSIGASAVFNGAATGSNPAQTANRAVPLDVSQTVGSILFNTDLSTFTNSLTVGTAGSLTLDAAGAGPATITTIGGGTGNNTISAPIILTDSLTAIVNNTAASSAAGSLNLTATITGAGGVTKQGDGLMTFGTGTKTYTGATVLSGGRTRMSLIAHATATSSFTINTGAQLTLISAGSFNFGSGPLNLNGIGATTGPFAAFPGAIRNDTALAVTIGNPVTLQSDTLIHVQGTAGIVTFTNVVGGPGRLTLTAPGSDANQGTLALNGANSYAGGTTVRGGQLLLGSATATLGSGDVTIEGAAPAPGRLAIPSGVLNGISDVATLTLDGGGAGGVADFGFADLGAGINEVVGSLVLGGVPQSPGTYGSSSSPATFQNNEFFTGSGMITVIPEPEVATTLSGGLAALLGLRRNRRRRK